MSHSLLGSRRRGLLICCVLSGGVCILLILTFNDKFSSIGAPRMYQNTTGQGRLILPSNFTGESDSVVSTARQYGNSTSTSEDHGSRISTRQAHRNVSKTSLNKSDITKALQSSSNKTAAILLKRPNRTKNNWTEVAMTAADKSHQKNCTFSPGNAENMYNIGKSSLTKAKDGIGSSDSSYIFNKFRVPSSVDCAALINDCASETYSKKSKENNSTELHSLSLDIDRLLRAAKSSDIVERQYCQMFRRRRGYVMTSLTQEEEGYPVAYSVQVYKDVELFERLLRAIYRPQNYYCIHVDHTSDPRVHAAVRTIVNCFSNVFMPVELVDVVYYEMSVLEADLRCMEELLKKFKKWKYYINLTGQEFPLRTNLELVRILKILNGANNVHAAPDSFRKKHFYRYNFTVNVTVDVTIVMGEVHIIASRAFVDYIINNKTALTFRSWVSKTWVPDETFFSSLNHSPQLNVPGSYLGQPESYKNDYAYIARYKCWEHEWRPECACAGQFVHFVCVYGVGDLPRLAKRKELFANKFHADFQPVTYACMEELLYNRTREELKGTIKFNALKYYKELPFVKNHVDPPGTVENEGEFEMGTVTSARI